MKKTGVNANTINEPNLLFHSLDALDKVLSELGLDQMRLPVVHLQLILFNTCLKFEQQQVTSSSSSVYTYLRLKLIDICTNLNLINSVAFHQQALSSTVVAELKLQQDGSNANPLGKLKKKTI